MGRFGSSLYNSRSGGEAVVAFIGADGLAMINTSSEFSLDMNMQLSMNLVYLSQTSAVTERKSGLTSVHGMYDYKCSNRDGLA